MSILMKWKIICKANFIILRKKIGHAWQRPKTPTRLKATTIDDQLIRRGMVCRTEDQTKKKSSYEIKCEMLIFRIVGFG